MVMHTTHVVAIHSIYHKELLVRKLSGYAVGWMAGWASCCP